ncbi:hypothetical protein BSLG_010326 [Batrachochytrium salamandrivorans]|nr:hypothetical protein BSLG_010326 [Batrachochytrium salamandrivorans]
MIPLNPIDHVYSNIYLEENYRKNVTVDKSVCTAYIIDTAGQHEYKALRDQHLKDGKGFLLVFAMNDKSSLEEVKQLREQIMKLKETRKVPFVICANKCDLPADQIEVDIDSVKTFCREVKIPILNTSAKENINVEESFQELILNTSSNIAQINLQQAAGDGGREARIAIRKGRIEMNRLIKAEPFERVDGMHALFTNARIKKPELEFKETGKARAQISLSQKHIKSVKTSGDELATNIRVGVTARESLRRHDETRKVEAWKKKSVATITPKKEACSALIAIENKLISEYVAELKSKDDEYVKELRRQAEEIDKLLERMESQFKSFQGTLIEEIEHIESAFVEERKELIDSNVRDINQLFEERRKNEGKFMEGRADRIEDHIKQLETLRIYDAEEYNLVKIKLETDVQVLEKQLQQMRATYQLNTEKLEYNFQVLKKREEENGTILGAQKRKINRLTDHLNILKSKATKQERTFQQENTSLTDDYSHITEQFQASSSDHSAMAFYISDNGDYFNIDRIITEQQLGMTWSLPKEDLFRNIDSAFFNGLVGNDKKTNLNSQTMFEETKDAQLFGFNVESDAEKRESLAIKFQGQKGHSKTTKTILELLCNEAGFLVEDKLQRLLEPLHHDEQSLMKLDSIFKALGVETIEEIELLTSYFVAEKMQVVSDSHLESTSISVDEAAVPIHPNDVIRAIRDFVEHKQKNGSHRDLRIISGRVDSSGNDTETHLDDEIMDTTPMPIAPNAKTQNVQEYWQCMGNVIDEKGYRTWMAVYQAMEKYNKVLAHRWQLSQDISSVSNQNNELKILLGQYMSARINEELHIPPTQIMLAQAGILQPGHYSAKEILKK